jgi:predicted PurR-regulated permease PerM
MSDTPRNAVLSYAACNGTSRCAPPYIPAGLQGPHSAMRLFPPPPASRAAQIVAAACVLAMLYFGRQFLAPLALAGVLSLVIAPLKRKFARLGLGHTAGALVSVLLLGACIAWLAVVLTSQLFAMAADLPQYKEAVRTKLEQVRDLTVGPLERIETELSGIVPRSALGPAKKPPGRAGKSAGEIQPAQGQNVAPLPTATDTMTRIASSLWGPLGQAGIVLVLLVFILLEHEGLRDRMIRLAGEAEAGRTMQAVEDAAQGVSRFFLSQLAVNATFGLVLASTLWFVGVPHAALWGALAGVARFVPYVGALGAGVALAAFAAAIDPGWSLMFWSLGLFLAMELLVAHLVEPQVYGHSTGLAPLGVIVSALFWGVLWGPIGLLLSTPMTLCLVVAGRHVRVLEPISILLGDPPGLTAGLRLYQRALSGETREIVSAARIYLRRSNFARYCDQVLLPGLRLAATDFRAARIGSEQQERVRLTVEAAADSISAGSAHEGARRRRRSTSLLDANVGAHLHEARVQRLGRWKGSLEQTSSPVVLCVSLGFVWEELLSHLLARALRDEGIHSRGISLGPNAQLPELQAGERVSTVILPYPLEEELEAWQAAARALHVAHPQAMLLAVKPPAPEHAAAHDVAITGQVDLVVRSFSEGVAFVLAERVVGR